MSAAETQVSTSTGDNGIYTKTCITVVIDGKEHLLRSLKSPLAVINSNGFDIVDQLSEGTARKDPGDITGKKMTKLGIPSQLCDLQNTTKNFVILNKDGSVFFATDINRGQNWCEYCFESFDIEQRTASVVSPSDEEKLVPSLSTGTIIAWFLTNFKNVYFRVYNYDEKDDWNFNLIVEFFVLVPADETEGEAVDAATPATNEFVFYSYNFNRKHDGCLSSEPREVNLVLNGIEIKTWV